jgi:branched-chain amino acid transport system substrate-binding protein
MIEYLANKKGATKLALLHDTSDLGTGGRDALIKILKDHPEIKLSNVETWRQTDVDFGSQILKAQRSGAQVIYVIGAAEGSARILRQAKSLGIAAQFVSNTSVGNQKFLELAGDSAEGMMITWGAVDPKSARVQEISRKMKQKYNRDIDIFVAQAYDATNVVSDALKRSGTNKLAAAIRAGTYNFALGPLSFDKSGHNVRHIFIAKVVNGKFEVID